MSTVNGAKIKNTEQKVDRKRYDENMDAIDFSDAPWRKRDDVETRKDK